MIEFDRVSRRYGDLDAIRNLNLTLARGEMAFLTGHSGAGKSTLLRLLLLLDRPTGGEIRVNGERTASIPARSVPSYRRRFGVVFQEHRLLFDRSVHDNVALPLVMAGFSPRDSARRVRAALDKVGLLGSERANPATLSGGEQQRVGMRERLLPVPSFSLPTNQRATLTPSCLRKLWGSLKPLIRWV
ncbi:MAG: cell division ATP-binding protein FtsE [Halieaceae bacterium]|nr:MAG: cell division ATP-binding protein FtsE [Halieaceae bacterium]